MCSATRVLSFNGVEVGELVEAKEDVVHFRDPNGRLIAISAQAVLEHRGGVLRLICYDTGVHRWEVPSTKGGREPESPRDRRRPSGSRPRVGS